MNGLIVMWSGNSSHPIYWGVDQTWFNSGVCGASWCRPIFNANAVTTSNIFHLVNESWVIIDNIEVKGMRNNVNGCPELRRFQRSLHAALLSRMESYRKL